jgi:hypothetical protein
MISTPIDLRSSTSAFWELAAVLLKLSSVGEEPFPTCVSSLLHASEARLSVLQVIVKGVKLKVDYIGA